MEYIYIYILKTMTVTMTTTKEVQQRKLFQSLVINVGVQVVSWG